MIKDIGKNVVFMTDYNQQITDGNYDFLMRKKMLVHTGEFG
jgi:hypothetical protein